MKRRLSPAELHRATLGVAALATLNKLRPKTFRDYFHALRWQAFERYMVGATKPRRCKVYKFAGLNAAERYHKRNMHEQQKRCHANGAAVSRHLFSEQLEGAE